MLFRMLLTNYTCKLSKFDMNDKFQLSKFYINYKCKLSNFFIYDKCKLAKLYILQFDNCYAYPATDGVVIPSSLSELFQIHVQKHFIQGKKY